MDDLRTATDGRSWSAVSGPHGRGRLPSGRYRIGRVTTLLSGDQNRSYRDRTGLAWWCPIYSNFDSTRTGLGIHPDGGVSGTLGCIGITEDSTRPLYNALREAEGITLIVE